MIRVIQVGLGDFGRNWAAEVRGAAGCQSALLYNHLGTALGRFLSPGIISKKHPETWAASSAIS